MSKKSKILPYSTVTVASCIANVERFIKNKVLMLKIILTTDKIVFLEPTYYGDTVVFLFT